MTLDQALQHIAHAEEEAQSLGVPMSLAVVDAGGHLVALHRMDGAPWLTAEIAYSKAYTAAAWQRPSAEIGERWRDMPLLAQAVTEMTHGRFVARMGGVPIRRDGAIVGAIGASGGTGEQDVRVVEAALRAG